MFKERNSLLAEENVESLTSHTNEVVLNIDSGDETDRNENSQKASNLESIKPYVSEKLEPIREPILVREVDLSGQMGQAPTRPEHFQVSVRIIEARRLPGLDLNPVVRISVGDRKRTTSVQKSTNSPYFDEYFVFAFNHPRIEVFQQVIEVTLKDAKGLLESDATIGSFACDVGTVFAQPEHQFNQKWAELSDPNSGEHRGYVKVTISVNFKNDSLQSAVDDDESEVPALDSINNDDIEGSLLLPKSSSGRQPIQLIVKVYRAYGLTRAKSGLGGALRSLTGSKDSIDPYVCVSFAGKSAKTSTAKKSSSPVWNQQITFLDSFPLLFQNIKIEVKDEGVGSDSKIATHFVHIKDISCDGQDGYLPKFGPTFLNLYGASDQMAQDVRKSMNAGYEEGVAYVGRLLVAITTDLVDLLSPDLERVSVQNIGGIDETFCGQKREFALFGALYSVSRTDEKYCEKGIAFELNMGDPNDLDADGKVDESDKKARKQYRGTTVAFKPERCYSNSQEKYYFLNLDTAKPLMFHRFWWVDDTWRLFISNRIIGLKRNLQAGIADVRAVMITDEINATRRLLGVFDQASEDLNHLAKDFQNTQDFSGITQLDFEKIRALKLELSLLANDVSMHRQSLNLFNLSPATLATNQWVAQLNHLANFLPTTFPDVFLSMIVDDKRVGQTRIAVRDIIYSPSAQDQGWMSGKCCMLLLRVPGLSSQKIVCQVQITCWFGLTQYLSVIPRVLKPGFQPDLGLLDLGKPEVELPPYVKYQQKETFEIRAHIYQGRSLIGADASGLSDPFVKVHFDHCVLVSHIEYKTLSPVWDELLIGPKVSLIGSRESLQEAVLSALIEIWDRDLLGKDEFMGRSIVQFNNIRFAEEPYKPARLTWNDVSLHEQEAGQILAALELVQISPKDNSEDYPRAIPSVRKFRNLNVFPIPPLIRPTLSMYRLQIVFWGVRGLKKVQWMEVSRPRADIECGGTTVSSSVIVNYRKNSNFPNHLQEVDLMLPDQEFYCPPLSIRVGDCRAFGRFTPVGHHLVRSLAKIFCTEEKLTDFSNIPKRTIEVEIEEIKAAKDVHDSTEQAKSKKRRPEGDSVALLLENSDDDDIDWWVRYEASKMGSAFSKRRGSKSSFIPCQMHFQIFSGELENFFTNDPCKIESYPLTRGKLEGETSVETRNVGVFKGGFKLFKYPLKNADAFEFLPSNEPVSVLVRVYLIRAYDVKPTDANGKADLYPVLRLGSQKISDSDNYVPNCLDPVFGRIYEFEANFPKESILSISLKDYDAFSSDELIGTTEIDLEDRLYSLHRMTCGLPKVYQISGPCKWRDALKPSQILAKICRQMKIQHLIIAKNQVQIDKTIFTLKDTSKREDSNSPSSHDQEQLCLSVLNNWKKAFGFSLVPEHVETRNLYLAKNPGVKQGKIELFVDIFRTSDPRPPAISIIPCKPRSYELRVIIWNTKDVVLDDESIVSGEKMSDIYIKGWLTDPSMAQRTDVHFRSVTGEGNFNWRFIFPFDYLPTEGVAVIKKKDFFSLNSTEMKFPCRLNLQAWDYDSFSGDDFLGCLPLDLIDFPRGFRTAKECDLSILPDSESVNSSTINKKRVNLFREKRLRGWWPLYARCDDGSIELTGKIEADFELLTKEEAEANPAGLGRDGPLALEEPKRPETSFLWFTDPWKSFKHIFWSRRKWLFIKFLLLSFLILFFLLFFYSVPGYTVKKIMGV